MITLNLLCLLLAFVCFAADAWRTRSLTSAGLALLTLAWLGVGVGTTFR
jgi:hypothetical protein